MKRTSAKHGDHSPSVGQGVLDAELNKKQETLQ